MAWTCKPVLARAATAILAGGICTGAFAQQMQQLPPVQGAPSSSPYQQPPAKSRPAAQPSAPANPGASPKAQGAAPASGSKSSAAAGSEAGLKQRVDQLEEQLVDMQVVIGTLESLAKSGGGGGGPASASSAVRQPPAAGAYSSSDAARIDGLETQIRALTAQLEQLADQVRALSAGAATPAGRRSDAPPSRFGSTTVTQGDQIGAVIAADSATQTQSSQWPTSSSAPLPPVSGGEAATPKQLYEGAYGYLLQQDYGAAEAGFDDFLKRYPSDPLAANAQYWLGETYFVRGLFKPAAAAFLKGYQTYAKSGKAPDSLLKLAMSLDKLGQRDAACSSFAELNTRFPNAPSHVKSKAQSERHRIGCG